MLRGAPPEGHRSAEGNDADNRGELENSIFRGTESSSGLVHLGRVIRSFRCRSRILALLTQR